MQSQTAVPKDCATKDDLNAAKNDSCIEHDLSSIDNAPIR